MEIWESVVGFEGFYEVSNMGNVRSLDVMVKKHDGMKLRKGIIRKPQKASGYLFLMLSSNGKAKRLYVHRIVAEAFIPNIDGKPQVNHIDGNKLNNHASNLEWVTCRENIKHAHINGMVSTVGTTHHKSKLTESDVMEIYKAKGLHREIAVTYGVSKSIVTNIKSGLNWSHITGHIK